MADTKTLNETFETLDGGIGLSNSGEGTIKKEYDYRGIFSLSEGRKEVTSKDNAGFGKYYNKDGKFVPKTNSFGLNSYYWYPENFTTFISKDLYNSKEIKELLNNAPKSIDVSITNIPSIAISTAQNAIKSTAKEITDTYGEVKSTIGSITRDKVTNQVGEVDSNLLEMVPYIKITEFQPLQEIESFLRNMKAIYEVLQDLFSSNPNGASRLERLRGVFSVEGLESIFDQVLQGNQDDPDYIRNVLRIPNFFYENMIGGTYVAEYKVPYFNQETYLNANGAQGWESRSIKQQFLGNFVSGLVDKIPGIGQFDIAGRPKFSLEGNNPLPDPVTTTFQLYNYNTTALKNNLKFLHSIVPGAFWLQSGFLQIPSNLYDVEVPGRFKYYLCKANIKVDWHGKTRVLKNTVRGELKSLFPKITNEDALSRVPDYYTVTIEFTSLLPNNFNTYLNYQIGNNKIALGQFRQEKTAEIVSAVRKEIANINDGTKTAAANQDSVNGTQQ